MKNNFETAYQEAFELAGKRLLGRDPEQVCKYSAAVLVEKSSTAAELELEYVHSPVRLHLPGLQFSPSSGSELHIWDKILLLHYLENSQQTEPAARQVGFKELKSAALYFRLFESRCLRPLVKAFGNQPELLLEKARRLGGEAVSAGDCAVRLQVLPKVPVSIIVWKADEEFPASANFLFSSSIEHYLSAEDIVVMCQRVAQKLSE